MVAEFSTMITVGSLNKICRPCSFTQDVSAATRDRLDLKRAETTQLTAVVWTRGWRWKRCSPQRAKTQWECHGMPIKLAKSKGMVLFCWQQLLKEVKFWKQTSLRKQLNSEFVVFAQLVIPQFRMFSRRKCLYDFNRWMSISMPHRGGWFGRGCVSSSKLFAWSPKTYNLILRLWGIITKNMPAGCVKRRQLQYKSYKTGIKSEVHLFGRIKL